MGKTRTTGFLTNEITVAPGSVGIDSLAGVGTRMVTADTSGNLSTAAIPGGGGSTFLKSSTVLNFGTNEANFVVNTISSALITNANVSTAVFRPIETTETSLDDFTLNGVSFNIENIIDGVSFDIRGNAVNNASGNYTINYSIGY